MTGKPRPPRINFAPGKARLPRITGLIGCVMPRDRAGATSSAPDVLAVATAV
ncbi:hypothetical protein ACWEQG_37610 [Microbispora sp. NPDC004025]